MKGFAPDHVPLTLPQSFARRDLRRHPAQAIDTKAPHDDPLTKESKVIRTLSGVLAVSMTALTSTAALAQSTTENPTASDFPWRAQGNEPFWSLTITTETMAFQPMDGTAIEAALPAPEVLPDGSTRYAASELVVTLIPEICRDSMTGMPHPISADVAVGDQTFAGCGGAPVDLMAGPEWQVTMIGDAEVEMAGSVTISVDPAGTEVHGASDCNRFFGPMSLTGEGLSFGPDFGASMMMCEDTQMATERHFLDAMMTVTRFDIAQDGALVLLSGDDAVIRAER
jgi:heat shock protein HslJ